jgi:S1-C subfamily serine protease
MKSAALLLSAVLLSCPLAIARPGHPLESQLVTIRITSQRWDEYRPWQRNKPGTRTFVGTVLPNGRILTIADDLGDATLIQVEKYDRPPRLPARIIHCDQQAGLAVLTVDEPGFFDDLTPVEIAESTEGSDYYSATWKAGQLSLSACRWAQVKVFASSMSYLNYVGIHFITDLKGGGWGEPVFCNGRLIGLANAQTDDRARVLPAEFIRAYLQAVDRPEYPGFAWLGINYQVNKGPAQAAYAGQEGPPTGIRIRRCFPGSSADGCLLPDDILLELDGHRIDSLGDYVHPRYGPVDVSLIASDGYYAGDVIAARVLRDRKEITVEIPLKNVAPSAALIPDERIGTPPPYLVAGGLVFRELDVPYLKVWGDEWKDKIPSYLRVMLALKAESPTPGQQRLIILADVFPDEYNIGYHDMAQNIVERVNGVRIDSIRGMEEAFRHPVDGFHIIEFMPSYGMSKVILDAETFAAATAAIMEKYQIPVRIRTRP